MAEVVGVATAEGTRRGGRAGGDDAPGSSGGGEIFREENLQLLLKNGFVVYLHCDVDNLLERTRRDFHRPLLNTEEDPRNRLEALLNERKPLYSGCADLTVDTGIMQSKDVVIQILDIYEAIQN